MDVLSGRRMMIFALMCASSYPVLGRSDQSYRITPDTIGRHGGILRYDSDEIGRVRIPTSGSDFYVNENAIPGWRSVDYQRNGNEKKMNSEYYLPNVQRKKIKGAVNLKLGSGTKFNNEGEIGSNAIYNMENAVLNRKGFLIDKKLLALIYPSVQTRAMNSAANLDIGFSSNFNNKGKIGSNTMRLRSRDLTKKGYFPQRKRMNSAANLHFGPLSEFDNRGSIGSNIFHHRQKKFENKARGYNDGISARQMLQPRRTGRFQSAANLDIGSGSKFYNKGQMGSNLVYNLKKLYHRLHSLLPQTKDDKFNSALNLKVGSASTFGNEGSVGSNVIQNAKDRASYSTRVPQLRARTMNAAVNLDLGPASEFSNTRKIGSNEKVNRWVTRTGYNHVKYSPHFRTERMNSAVNLKAERGTKFVNKGDIGSNVMYNLNDAVLSKNKKFANISSKNGFPVVQTRIMNSAVNMNLDYGSNFGNKRPNSIWNTRHGVLNELSSRRHLPRKHTVKVSDILKMNFEPGSHFDNQRSSVISHAQNSALNHKNGYSGSKVSPDEWVNSARNLNFGYAADEDNEDVYSGDRNIHFSDKSTANKPTGGHRPDFGFSGKRKIGNDIFYQRQPRLMDFGYRNAGIGQVFTPRSTFPRTIADVMKSAVNIKVGSGSSMYNKGEIGSNTAMNLLQGRRKFNTTKNLNQRFGMFDEGTLNYGKSGNYKNWNMIKKGIANSDKKTSLFRYARDVFHHVKNAPNTVESSTVAENLHKGGIGFSAETLSTPLGSYGRRSKFVTQTGHIQSTANMQNWGAMGSNKIQNKRDDLFDFSDAKTPYTGSENINKADLGSRLSDVQTRNSKTGSNSVTNIYDAYRGVGKREYRNIQDDSTVFRKLDSPLSENYNKSKSKGKSVINIYLGSGSLFDNKGALGNEKIGIYSTSWDEVAGKQATGLSHVNDGTASLYAGGDLHHAYFTRSSAGDRNYHKYLPVKPLQFPDAEAKNFGKLTYETSVNSKTLNMFPSTRSSSRGSFINTGTIGAAEILSAHRSIVSSNKSKSSAPGSVTFDKLGLDMSHSSNQASITTGDNSQVVINGKVGTYQVSIPIGSVVASEGSRVSMRSFGPFWNNVFTQSSALQPKSSIHFLKNLHSVITGIIAVTSTDIYGRKKTEACELENPITAIEVGRPLLSNKLLRLLLFVTKLRTNLSNLLAYMTATDIPKLQNNLYVAIQVLYNAIQYRQINLLPLLPFMLRLKTIPQEYRFQIMLQVLQNVVPPNIMPYITIVIEGMRNQSNKYISENLMYLLTDSLDLDMLPYILGKLQDNVLYGDVDVFVKKVVEKAFSGLKSVKSIRELKDIVYLTLLNLPMKYSIPHLPTKLRLLAHMLLLELADEVWICASLQAQHISTTNVYTALKKLLTLTLECSNIPHYIRKSVWSAVQFLPDNTPWNDISELAVTSSAPAAASAIFGDGIIGNRDYSSMLNVTNSLGSVIVEQSV